MTSAQFRATALDLLKNYWRIKAANALYRSARRVTADRLDYSNVPAVGFSANQFVNESIVDASMALNTFVLQRLPRDLLLALIAEFESRLVARLRSLGQPEDGTLGALQTRIQARTAIPPLLIDDLNELRERRNVMIHHGDIAGAKYVTASASVLPRAAQFIRVASIGDNVSPTEGYLAYAADVLVRYSDVIGWRTS